MLPLLPWCGSGWGRGFWFFSRFGCGSGFLFDADADLDPTFHPDTNPDPDPHLNQIKIQIHNQIDIKNQNPLPESTFHPETDPDFYLMRIQVTQWWGSMRIRIHNTGCKCTVQTDCREHATYFVQEEPVLILICEWIDWDMTAENSFRLYMCFTCGWRSQFTLVLNFFRCPYEFTEPFTYFFKLMRICVDLIMLAAFLSFLLITSGV